jgi:hypothetical protein
VGSGKSGSGSVRQGWFRQGVARFLLEKDTVRKSLSEWIYCERAVREWASFYGDKLHASGLTAIEAMLKQARIVEDELVCNGVHHAFAPIMRALQTFPSGAECDAEDEG